MPSRPSSEVAFYRSVLLRILGRYRAGGSMFGFNWILSSVNTPLSFWGAPDPALSPGLTQNDVPKALGTYFDGKRGLRAPGYRLVPCARPKLRHLIIPSLELKTVPRYLPEGKISSKRKHRSTIAHWHAAGLAASFGRGGIDGARLGSASYRPCCRYFKVLNVVVHCTGTRVVSETLPGTARI
jgi:hypothetical protein